MPYEIIIKQTRTVTKKVGKEWKVVGTKPSAYMSGAEYQADEYGYTPEIEKDVEETHEILTQRVETLDLAAVIKAINGL